MQSSPNIKVKKGFREELEMKENLIYKNQKKVMK